MTKYLIIGNGESPHILKWVKELTTYFELYLVSSQDVTPKIKELIPEDRIFTFHLMVSDSGGNVQFMRMVVPLIRIINKVKPDFVNAHYITSHGVVAAIAKQFSRHQFTLIQSAWGSDILLTPFRNAFYKKLTRFALKHASVATTDSKTVAGIIHELTSVETITFPFGLEKLPDAFPDEKISNLFFSNRTLNANSNIDRVLHFFARFLAQHQDARLVVANDGPLKEELTQLTRQLNIQGAVEFVRFISQDEQFDYYRKSQFYFSILSSDALSVSLLEAMAFGCIPLVSNLPDNREWVKDGISGVIMTEHTTPDILLTMQSKAQQIAEMNRELIAEKAIFPKSIEVFNQRLRSL